MVFSTHCDEKYFTNKPNLSLQIFKSKNYRGMFTLVMFLYQKGNLWEIELQVLVMLLEHLHLSFKEIAMDIVDQNNIETIQPLAFKSA